MGSDWLPTIAIVVEKSGDFTVVGCDCLDDCHALLGLWPVACGLWDGGEAGGGVRRYKFGG